MPKITKVMEINVTPQRFVDACDTTEFQELILEVNRRIDRERRQMTIHMVIEEESKLSDKKNTEGC